MRVDPIGSESDGGAEKDPALVAGGGGIWRASGMHHANRSRRHAGFRPGRRAP
jgi:hypothetical protein